MESLSFTKPVGADRERSTSGVPTQPTHIPTSRAELTSTDRTATHHVERESRPSYNDFRDSISPPPSEPHPDILSTDQLKRLLESSIDLCFPPVLYSAYRPMSTSPNLEKGLLHLSVRLSDVEDIKSTIQGLNDWVRKMEEPEKSWNIHAKQPVSGLDFWVEGQNYIMERPPPLLPASSAVKKRNATPKPAKPPAGAQSSCSEFPKKQLTSQVHGNKGLKQPYTDGPFRQEKDVPPPIPTGPTFVPQDLLTTPRPSLDSGADDAYNGSTEIHFTLYAGIYEILCGRPEVACFQLHAYESDLQYTNVRRYNDEFRDDSVTFAQNLPDNDLTYGTEMMSLDTIEDFINSLPQEPDEFERHADDLGIYGETARQKCTNQHTQGQDPDRPRPPSARPTKRRLGSIGIDGAVDDDIDDSSEVVEQPKKRRRRKNKHWVK